MGYETYHIPVNYTDAGKLFGLFEIRNVVEAVLIGLPVLALCSQVSAAGDYLEDHCLPVLFVPTVGFALIGLKDDSLTRYLKTWWIWRQRRRVVTYRGEVHPHESERRYLRQFRCGRP